MTLILIPGLWLTGGAWAATRGHLAELGHDAVALDLPGQTGDGTPASFDDQTDAVLTAVDGCPDGAVVVGHSAAATLAWVAADRRPEAVRAVVMIGGFPSGDGQTYADFFKPEDGWVPFPGWEPFEGPDAEDLDADLRREFEAGAVPVPEAVTRGVVRLTDERRYAVPTVLVCPEFSPEEARAWIDGGDLPELARADDLTFVDIDSGHWPMLTQPQRLAALLADI